MKNTDVNTSRLIKQSVGLGDVLKKATSAIGIKPCEACNRRAAKLNSMMSFGPRKSASGRK